MDFFDRQDKARKKTWLLALYFIAAIFFIVVAVNAAFYFFFKFVEAYPYTPKTWFTEHVWMYVSGVTLLVILTGSFSRLAKLSGGGKIVAQMAGARLLDLGSHKADEKKFINVVEEMSIASGTPMPVLYIMDGEDGINAFVAGYKPTEAVMVVTQGALEILNRDELQAVVGHEFSHILNGDMRINIRLMAILAGILIIGQIGQFLLRGSGRHNYQRNSKGSSGSALMVLAFGLMVIGYVGLFFGRLIKAAISRQREFLADASSVQFTRNPKGIAGALYKIQQSVNGTRLFNLRAEDVSHMCFAEALKINMQSLLATHPPLEQRIKAVDASFLKIQRAIDIQNRKNKNTSDLNKNQSSEAQNFSATAAIHTSAQQLSESVGNPAPEHMIYAALMLQSFTPVLMENVHNMTGAQSVIYALLLSNMEVATGLACLAKHVESAQVEKLNIIKPEIKNLNKRHRLPLIDLALPVLKQLPAQKTAVFLTATEALIKCDKKVTLFEFVLFTILKKHLNKNAGKADKVRIFSFKSVQDELTLLMSLMGHAGKQTSQKKQLAFSKAMLSFGVKSTTLLTPKQCKFKAVSRVLSKLNLMSPLLKKSVLLACADMVLDDGVVMPAEAELLRAVSEMLDCPMPPLLGDETAG